MFSFASKPPGLMIAAPRSGSGKTAVTLGLLRALSRRGLSVQPFKCGPDYIDPAFHAAACGRPSYNLDSWAMREETALALLDEAAGADFVVIEALMGLFDGVASQGAWGNGSSAGIAALTGWPVIAVLDISGQSQTAAAAVRGFVGFQEGVEIAGVILNRVASPRHERLARGEFERIGIPVLGAIPRQGAIELPERHLGLVQASETSELDMRLNALADLIEAHVDIEQCLKAASCHEPALGGAEPRPEEGTVRRTSLPPPSQRIALANDAAFSFVYPHILKGWRDAGAEICPFSPLADQAPDPDAGLVWLPGGYPELHAGTLAANANFLEGVRSFAAKKLVHGECGGYMVLGQWLVDASGDRHAMLGLLGLETSFAARKLHLGYRKAQLLSDCPLGKSGDAVAGHEFHYAATLAASDERWFDLSDSDGNPLTDGGSRRVHVTGSFFHFVDRLG
jgi:cobyrinic acid a,c-diamide synthase